MNLKAWHRFSRKSKLLRNSSVVNNLTRKARSNSSFMASSLIDTITDQKTKEPSDNYDVFMDIDHLIQNFLKNLSCHPKTEFEHRFLMFIKPYCRNNVLLPPFLRQYYLFNSLHLTFIMDLRALLLKFLELYFMENYEQFLYEGLMLTKKTNNNKDEKTISKKSDNLSPNPLLQLQEMSTHIDDSQCISMDGISVIEKGVVICIDRTIIKGSLFGPIQTNAYMDSTKKTKNEWMLQVGFTNDRNKQNLFLEFGNGFVFYRVTKDIKPGIRLLLPNKSSLNFMGLKEPSSWSRKKPVNKYLIRTNIDASYKFGKIRRPSVSKEIDISDTKKLTTDSDKIEGFSCEQCGKMFAYEYYKAKHLKYTRCVDQGNRKFPCSQCSRSFEKRDRLRIHVLHVHEKHRPHKCTVCGKSFSQSSSLNKHLRVHSGERPYKCVYCNKAFTASSILRTHIRQHSGEKPFKCKYCWKSFASHAAHDSHVRRTHGQNEPPKKSEENEQILR